MIQFFYSFYSGQGVTLSDFGILGNCLCSTGEHLGLFLRTKLAPWWWQPGSCFLSQDMELESYARSWQHGESGLPALCLSHLQLHLALWVASCVCREHHSLQGQTPSALPAIICPFSKVTVLAQNDRVRQEDWPKGSYRPWIHMFQPTLCSITTIHGLHMDLTSMGLKSEKPAPQPS